MTRKTATQTHSEQVLRISGVHLARLISVIVLLELHHVYNKYTVTRSDGLGCLGEFHLR